MGSGWYGSRTVGKEEIKELTQSTISALHDAGLDVEVAALQQRLFSRPPTDLFEVDADAHGVQSWRYKPIIELLLRHARAIAANREQSEDERQREIRWALDLSGF
jgi:hypothetical protein